MGFKLEFSKRKWGYYWTLYSAERFKLKFLYFRKGYSCSMQRHKERSELWLFLFGDGDLYHELPKSFYSQMSCAYRRKKGGYMPIDFYEWHKFTARKNTLVLEIQAGSNCREDDIERKE